jgi:hypothetical protein
MRIGLISFLLVAAVLPAFSQAQVATVPPPPKDPHAIFEAAAPYYNFADPSMKPWHLTRISTSPIADLGESERGK